MNITEMLANWLMPDGAEAFLESMAEHPGEGTYLLVFADWLEEHDRPERAAAVRTQTPGLVDAYHRASACRSALLGLDLGSVRPFPLPPPDNGNRRTPGQWAAVVTRALEPFALPTVRVSPVDEPSYPYDVTLGVPAGKLRIVPEDPAYILEFARHIGPQRLPEIDVPWWADPSAPYHRPAFLVSAEQPYLDVVNRVLDALMTRLFPHEPLRYWEETDEGGRVESHGEVRFWDIST